MGLLSQCSPHNCFISPWATKEIFVAFVTVHIKKLRGLMKCMYMGRDKESGIWKGRTF